MVYTQREIDSSFYFKVCDELATKEFLFLPVNVVKFDSKTGSK